MTPSVIPTHQCAMGWRTSAQPHRLGLTARDFSRSERCFNSLSRGFGIKGRETRISFRSYSKINKRCAASVNHPVSPYPYTRFVDAPPGQGNRTCAGGDRFQARGVSIRNWLPWLNNVHRSFHGPFAGSPADSQIRASADQARTVPVWRQVRLSSRFSGVKRRSKMNCKAGAMVPQSVDAGVRGVVTFSPSRTTRQIIPGACSTSASGWSGSSMQSNPAAAGEFTHEGAAIAQACLQIGGCWRNAEGVPGTSRLKKAEGGRETGRLAAIDGIAHHRWQHRRGLAAVGQPAEDLGAYK